jgi:capsular exopolysaccharide synthesis family protein
MQGGIDKPESEEAGASFSLGDLVSMLRKRAIMIIAITAAVTGLAAAILINIPNRYEASATVQIDPRKRTIVPVENVVSDLKTDTSVVESELEVLRSRTIAVRVIEVLGLRQDPEFSEPGPIGKTLALLGLNTWRLQRAAPPVRKSADEIARLLDGDRSQAIEPEKDEVAAAFASRLKVFRVRNSLVIDIRFTSKDAIKAARIANAIADAYIRDGLDSKIRATSVATELLEQKLDGLRQKLASDERRVAQYKNENGIIDTEGQLLSEKELARLMEQSVMARNTTAEARAKYDQVVRLQRAGDDKSGIGDVLQSHTIRMLKEQLTKVSRREAEQATRYGPRHPEMLKIRAEVRDTQGQLDAEISQIVTNLKTEFEIASERERQLTASLDRLKAQQSTSRETSVHLRELEREAATSRQLFESFLVRHKQTLETQTMQLPDSRVIERADVPLYPSSPKRKQMLMAAIGGGLALALGLAFLLEFAGGGVRRPDDVERDFGVPLLGSIPALPDADPEAPLPARLILAAPRSAFSEAIRETRREIDIHRPSVGPRVVLVASALPNEGKSLIASNLAHHLAVTGTRTLLIDADLRRARLSRTLGLSGAPGLTEILSGRIGLDDAILQDQKTGLAVLPARGTPFQDAPAPELLASPDFAATLNALRGRYDTIVIDAPPLLPVVDARVVADLADQIVLTVVWRRTPKDLARRALKLLGHNHDKIAGVIVNRVEGGAQDGRAPYGEAVVEPVRRRRA